MNKPLLPTVTDIYSYAQRATISGHPIDHSGLRSLYVQIGRLLSQISQSEDPYWAPLRRHLSRLRFDLSCLPVQFNSPLTGLAERQCRTEQYYARSSDVYSEVAPLVSSVLAAARDILTCADAPVLESLTTLADKQDEHTGIVMCEARFIPIVASLCGRHSKLQGCEIVGTAQLRSLRTFCRLICIGSARWFPAFVIAAPRAPIVEFIHFKWTPGPKQSAPTFDPEARAAAEHCSFGSPKIIVVMDPESIEPENLEQSEMDGESQPESLVLEELVERAKDDSATTNTPHESVKALPVVLEGGRGVFLDAEEGSTALIIDLAERGKNRVRRVAVADIEPGTFVLLRASGAGDFVVDVANGILGARAEPYRQIQRDWKERLRREVESQGLLGVSIALLDLGSARADEGNVRRWMWDRSIRPRDYDDFLAIMKLIGSEDAGSQYWEVMSRLERTHIHAGQLIRRRLITQVRDSDLSELELRGTMEFDLPDIGAASMMACRVIRIGSEPLTVSHTRIGQLTEMLPLWR